MRGVVCPLDVVVATGTAGTGLQEQLRRAPDADALAATGRRLPALLAELLRGGLGSARVLAVYSALVDACVRRAIELVLAEHPELPPDGFTWLSIGSNGRREAVLSSDVDSAVSFDDGLAPATVAGLPPGVRARCTRSWPARGWATTGTGRRRTGPTSRGRRASGGRRPRAGSTTRSSTRAR